MPVTKADPAIANPTLTKSYSRLLVPEGQPGEYRLLHSDPAVRLFFATPATDPPAVLLPLDRLFDIRCAAALQLWRLASGKPPGKGPKPLTAQYRARLLLALRALDAHLQHASYRDIAKGLLHLDAMTARTWQTHDARDRIIRLVHLGTRLMDGGYRQLLLYPFRARL